MSHPNLETFLAALADAGHELPRHVEKELREYVGCGALGAGFLQLRCGGCGEERVVAFSCKGRGFCPTCTGRRMADTSARLVDDVFPEEAPVRQWVLSPPLEIGRLARIDDDRLSFRLKTPWADGTTHLVLSPMELIEKLAALVPPPRINLVRYHGVLAAHAKDRDKIVPKKPDAEKLRGERGASKNRLLWAALLARVFAIDVTKCPKCDGRLRLVAAITDRASAKRYLDHVGLPSEIPSLAPARAPPQLDFDW